MRQEGSGLKATGADQGRNGLAADGGDRGGNGLVAGRSMWPGCRCTPLSS